ncbi:MAG: hypothetical protein QNK04_23595 [Myxococcota bacterium]|nr:hypothetical protein [Myxococcota bacterium]
MLGIVALLAALVAVYGLLAPQPPGARGGASRVEGLEASSLPSELPTRDLGVDPEWPRGSLLPSPSSLDYDHAVRIYNRGVGLLMDGAYYDALLPLSEAYGAFPDSPEFCYALARVYHVLNLTGEAVALLPCLRDSPAVPAVALRQLIDQLEKSADFELEFAAAASDHFVVSHPRGGAAAARIGEVLDLLERSRDSVAGLLRVRTRRQVPVVVYEAVDFGEATGAADWAGGSYDGKIRIAIEFLERDPDEFASALRHEYVHALLHELTGARVPAWLHEGLANLVIEQRYDPDALRRRLHDRITLPDIGLLSRSFARLPAETATLLYQQSYWLTRALVDQHGFRGITDLIQALEVDLELGFEEAFRDRFGVWPEDHLDAWYDGFLM